VLFFFVEKKSVFLLIAPKMTARPTEFSEESVRQFMLANGGRVTNHELVKHFKSW
jgi:hypothetical protein